MLSIGWTLISFIVAISVLVTVHEWGHFWVARRLGVRVQTFAIGFGKPWFCWRDKHATQFQIGYIPLGGYVKLLDSTLERVSPEQLPYAFDQQAPWRRILIAAAGPLANVLFAVVACWWMFMLGIQTVVPMIGAVTPGSIAQRANLMPGMIIVELNQRQTHHWRDVLSELIVLQGRQTPVAITLRDAQGQLHQHQLNLAQWQMDDPQQHILQTLGIQAYQPEVPAMIDQVIHASPAARAGIAPGDQIVAVNDEPITDWHALVKYIRQQPLQPLTLQIVRQEQIIQLTVTPEWTTADNGESAPMLGIVVASVPWPDHLRQQLRYSPIAALSAGIQEAYRLTRLTWQMVGQLITGRLSVQHLTGPVGIAQGAGIAASIGLAYYLAFLALVSVSLATLNLLPIPILDGGHILFGLIEWFRGKPVSPTTIAISSKMGLWIIGGFILLAIYNDIGRLW
ncbi:MAG: RIP metalloprotease RseP [Legionellales bacterium]|nr:RIP metalloprotease RseP [Legionellales bacterium]